MGRSDGQPYAAGRGRGLDVRPPGVAPVERLFPDPKRLIDTLRLLGAQEPTAVGDRCFGAAAHTSPNNAWPQGNGNLAGLIASRVLSPDAGQNGTKREESGEVIDERSGETRGLGSSVRTLS